MPEDPSSTADQNLCQSASEISKPEKNNPRPRIFTFAKWLRWFGYVIAILGVVLILTSYHIASNHYQIEEYWQASVIFYTGFWYAHILFYVSIIAITIGIGIPCMEKQKYPQKQQAELNTESYTQRRYTKEFLLWMPVIIGASLLLVNLIGWKSDDSYRDRYILGWPIIHTVTKSDMFYSYQTPGSIIRFFRAYWLVVDLFIGALIILCSTIAFQYVNNRWITKKQYTLKELLVFVTSAAFLLSFISIERYTHFSSLYILDNEPTYQPAYLLPLYMYIPILIGVICAVMVLGTAFFELFGLGIAKMFRTDAEED